MVMDNLLELKFRSFIAGFRAESVSLWFLCLYFFMEYIRPYDMYPVLDFLPWGQFSIILAVSSIFVSGCKANGFSVMDKMFIVISLMVVLSGIFAWSPAASLKYWSTYTSWILMYFCIVSILTTPRRMLLFVLFFLIINFKLSEHGAWSFAMRGFSFAHWGLSGPPGWFHNSGELAMQMTIVFSMSLCLILASKKYIENSKRWWFLLILFPGTAALTVIGSSSRGGQIALATIALIFFLKGKHFFRKTLLLIIVIFIGPYLLPAEQFERFNTMGDDQTSQRRLEHWENAQEVIKHNPLGIGYFNWRYYYPAHFDVIKIEEIHNTVLQAFTELGYPGGILFLLMIITTFVMNARTKREMDSIDDTEADAMAAIARGINLALLGTIIAAIFMSVLYHPVFWAAFALTSALRHISINKIKASKKVSTKLGRPSLLKAINTISEQETKTKSSHYGRQRQNYKNPKNE